MAKKKNPRPESAPIVPLNMEKTMRDFFLPAGDEKSDPRRQAQDLVYEAWDAPTEDAAADLARKAVALHPTCVDARLLLVSIEERPVEEQIAELHQIVADGKRDLGETFFTENKGHFWGLLETRPFMRAKASLAELLSVGGKPDDAITQYEEMLTLNPGDNQGVRYPLLGLYLLCDRLKEADKLLKTFGDEATAVFAWGRLLLDLIKGEKLRALVSLQRAREVNPYVEPYLRGRKELPDTMPEFVGAGDENEAVECAYELIHAWLQHPQAYDWFLSQPQQRHGSKRKKK